MLLEVKRLEPGVKGQLSVDTEAIRGHSGFNTDFGRGVVWGGWYSRGVGVGEGTFCRISICIFGHMPVQVKQNPLGTVFTAHSELTAMETSLKEWLTVFGQASVLRRAVCSRP